MIVAAGVGRVLLATEQDTRIRGHDGVRALEDEETLGFLRAPPFDAGHPDRCRPVVLERVRERGAALRKEREALVGRVASRLG
ncbi:MAG: hypothetical protein ABI369_14360 [Acetobacteraceae bacterium]